MVSGITHQDKVWLLGKNVGYVSVSLHLLRVVSGMFEGGWQIYFAIFFLHLIGFVCCENKLFKVEKLKRKWQKHCWYFVQSRGKSK